MHRGGFCQFPFQWIYYYGSGKETGKKHLCAMLKLAKLGIALGTYQLEPLDPKPLGFAIWQAMESRITKLTMVKTVHTWHYLANCQAIQSPRINTMNSLTMLVGFLVHSCTLLHSLSGILNVNICD